jgi:cell division protein FtsW
MKNQTEIYRPHSFDKPLLFITLLLLAIGLIMVLSTTAIRAGEIYHQPFYFFLNQAIGAILGLIFLFIIISQRSPFYQNPLFIFGLLLLSFLLLGLCLLMPAFRHTHRWVYFFGLRFQPSELAKFSLIFFLAYYLSKRPDRLGNIKTFLIPLVTIGVFVLLIIREPDYGTAFFIFLLAVIILFIGGIPLTHLIGLGLCLMPLFVLFLVKVDYRLNRIIALLFPGEDPLGKGFQLIQSKLAIGAGGILGVSLGESVQKLYFLPCAHTDFIYAIIGEELGLIGTLSILGLFILFLWRGIIISLKAPNNYSQLLAAGISLAIFFQAVMNISIVLGLIPPTGLPLPFISFGRSSLVVNLMATGILLHISQRRSGDRKQR